MPAISGRAFAKVNLGLRILDRRPDGYHELRTVYQTISLADRLAVEWTTGRRRDVEMTCDDPALAGPENLAARAARALLDAGPWRGRVRIALEKRVPMGAGLGGGSSDAGSALCALRALLDPSPDEAALQAAAASVGSDVPFFLVGGRALGVGRGEEVYPLPETARQWLVLVAPGVHVSTPQAYAGLARSRPALTPDRKGLILNVFSAGIRASGEASGDGLRGDWTNDFEDSVFERFPELRKIKGELTAAGAKRASLSGSGSALFGLFDSRESALGAVERLKTRGLVGRAVRTVGRREYKAEWSRAR
jgi:4-diphosphocytidyl-2-C-methyl-D-erythritol kinase